MPENKIWNLIKYPEGVPVVERDFELVTTTTPDLEDGELLIKTLFLSTDPYMRGRMRQQAPGSKSYIPPFQLGGPITGGGVGEVVESKSEEYKVGDVVVSPGLQWANYSVVKASDKPFKLDMIKGMGLSYSVSLGVLGMPGMTAFFGFLEICEPKEGETVVVSGAGGAVGSLVCQIAKIKGCKVVGIAGTQEKLDLITSYGVDKTINYKTATDINAAIKEAAPEGVDCYFDNVGGEIADAVLANMNRQGRISCCGAISSYNSTSLPVGPRDEFALISKSLKKQGFIVSNWLPRWPEGMQAMGGWIGQGKLKFTETVREGLENTPKAFIDMLSGGNVGKMIVKV